MVNVGIFGLGAHWETFYLPALQSLGKRMAVRAVYDPVSTRAELAARELGGAAVHGLTALAERSDVQAILLLDAAWHGDASLSIVRRQRKPVYIADRLPHNLVTLDQFHSDAIAEGLTFMPEFGRRYTPATCRLRELIATQLGRPQRILIETAFPRIDAAISPTDRVLLADLLIGWTDWCRYVVRTKPMVIEAKQLESADKAATAEQVIRIEYSKGKKRYAERPIAEIRLRTTPTAKSATGAVLNPDPIRQEVICELGAASVEGNTTIVWQNGEGGGRETLTSERSAIEVMLDHFCRRVVGGLIPVPDINDICRGLRLVAAVEQSLQTGQSVILEGNV